MIPVFRRDGSLPPGLHAAEWPEFAARFGGTPQRQRLLAGMQTALEVLRDAGCRTAYLDGSFVTAKREPNDFDGCWDLRGVIVELLDPTLLDFANGCAAQKAKYGGELFPAQVPDGVSGATFLEFFQTDRDGRRKGMIVLSLESLE